METEKAIEKLTDRVTKLETGFAKVETVLEFMKTFFEEFKVHLVESDKNIEKMQSEFKWMMIKVGIGAGILGIIGGLIIRTLLK